MRSGGQQDGREFRRVVPRAAAGKRPGVCGRVPLACRTTPPHTPDCPSPKAGSSAFLWAPPTAGLCVLRLEVEVSRSRGRLGDRLVPGRSFADPSPRGKGVEDRGGGRCGGGSYTDVFGRWSRFLLLLPQVDVTEWLKAAQTCFLGFWRAGDQAGFHEAPIKVLAGPVAPRGCGEEPVSFTFPTCRGRVPRLTAATPGSRPRPPAHGRVPRLMAATPRPLLPSNLQSPFCYTSRVELAPSFPC